MRQQRHTNNKCMKKFLTLFFCILGVVFFLLIVALVVFLVRNPNIARVIASVVTHDSPAPVSTEKTTDKNPVLNAAQEKTLETLGVDPASVPSRITPAQEKCFVSILGAARVAEIKAGGTPSAAEYFQAKGCL